MNDEDAERFMARVSVDTMTWCWNWTGYVATNGYGQLRRRGMTLLAHRASFEHFKGAITPGLWIDHLCRNRRCVNPEHLEAVTARENLLRGESPAARAHRAGECYRGHLMVGERSCGVCRRARNIERYRTDPEYAARRRRNQREYKARKRVEVTQWQSQ